MSKCCCNEKTKCDCEIIHYKEVQNVKENILEINKINQLNDLFKILSDETRLKILLSLEIEALCVCDIANVLDMTKSAVSHQLKVLRENNLVTFDKQGKSSYYTLANNDIKNIIKVGLNYFESNCLKGEE